MVEISRWSIRIWPDVRLRRRRRVEMRVVLPLSSQHVNVLGGVMPIPSCTTANTELLPRFYGHGYILES